LGVEEPSFSHTFKYGSQICELGFILSIDEVSAAVAAEGDRNECDPGGRLRRQSRLHLFDQESASWSEDKVHRCQNAFHAKSRFPRPGQSGIHAIGG
jgi:hypothetical protein